MTPRESFVVSRTTGRIRNTASAMNVMKRSATSAHRRRGGSVRRLYASHATKAPKKTTRASAHQGRGFAKDTPAYFFLASDS